MKSAWARGRRPERGLGPFVSLRNPEEKQHPKKSTLGAPEEVFLVNTFLEIGSQQIGQALAPLWSPCLGPGSPAPTRTLHLALGPVPGPKPGQAQEGTDLGIEGPGRDGAAQGRTSERHWAAQEMFKMKFQSPFGETPPFQE